MMEVEDVTHNYNPHHYDRDADAEEPQIGRRRLADVFVGHPPSEMKLESWVALPLR